MSLSLDPSISIEGAAAAIGVLGAATGYVINLFRSWRWNRRDRLERAAKFVVMALLEKDIAAGGTEDALFNEYGSPKTLKLRKGYGAPGPSLVPRIEFERLLKSLQLDGSIQLVGVDHYRLRVDKSPWEDREAERERARLQVLATIQPEVISSAVMRVFNDAGSDENHRRDALRILVELRTPEALEHAMKQLNSQEFSRVLAAADALAYARRP